jgi:hypothetical protein
MSTSVRSGSTTMSTQDMLLSGAVIMVIALVFGFIAGFQTAIEQESHVNVQMYVMDVDNGSDLERYRIEQEGDQFTYSLSEHVLRNIQQSPTFVNCVDGLAITSVWSQFAENANCDGPSIHVVLIAPY